MNPQQPHDTSSAPSKPELPHSPDASDAPCAEYIPFSPQNAAFAWCARYRINLDRGGRFCRQCQQKPTFRAILREQFAARFSCDQLATGSLCEPFAIATTPAQCRRCQNDPLYRSFLRGQGLARSPRNLPPAPCQHRGEHLRYEERPCCGGKTRQVDIFRCALHTEAHAGSCAECAEYEGMTGGELGATQDTAL